MFFKDVLCSRSCCHTPARELRHFGYFVHFTVLGCHHCFTLNAAITPTPSSSKPNRKLPIQIIKRGKRKKIPTEHCTLSFFNFLPIKRNTKTTIYYSVLVYTHFRQHGTALSSTQEKSRFLYTTSIYPYSATRYCLKLHSRKVKISAMDIDSNENSNWFFDCGLMEDISAVRGGDFRAEAPPPPPATCFSWPAQPLNSSSYGSAEVDCSFGDSEGQKEGASRKRSKSGSCNASGSKACREKLRRDKLTERFLELGSVLEPGRPPKTDKAAILSDAVRIVTQLRSEAQKLRESNEEIQERIKELKAEKNELRIEKQRLKEEKEKVEQQVKAMTAQPGFLPHPSTAMPAGYGAQGQAADNKLMPFISYPGVAMWQFVPPSVCDTSQDHVLHPPVA